MGPHKITMHMKVRKQRSKLGGLDFRCHDVSARRWPPHHVSRDRLSTYSSSNHTSAHSISLFLYLSYFSPYFSHSPLHIFLSRSYEYFTKRSSFSFVGDISQNTHAIPFLSLYHTYLYTLYITYTLCSRLLSLFSFVDLLSSYPSLFLSPNNRHSYSHTSWLTLLLHFRTR